MKFAIQVQPNHHWHESQHHVRQLSEQLITAGHEIVAILFFGSASSIAHQDSQHHWLNWDTERMPLFVCSTLASQLNINSDQPSIFTITGMATWMQHLEHADQLVVIP